MSIFPQVSRITIVLFPWFHTNFMHISLEYVCWRTFCRSRVGSPNCSSRSSWIIRKQKTSRPKQESLPSFCSGCSPLSSWNAVMLSVSSCSWEPPKIQELGEPIPRKSYTQNHRTRWGTTIRDAAGKDSLEEEQFFSHFLHATSWDLKKKKKKENAAKK